MVDFGGFQWISMDFGGLAREIRGQHTCRPSYCLWAHDSADGERLLACGTVQPAGVLDFRAKRGAVAAVNFENALKV